MGKAPASTDAQELSLNETGALKLMWYQGIGIDSIFEDPWRDQQSLWPYMVFDALVAEEVSNVSIVPKLATDWEISDDGKTVLKIEKAKHRRRQIWSIAACFPMAA